MKILLVFSYIVLSMLISSCGKNETGALNTNTFSSNMNTPTTVNGYFNLQTNMFEVGGIVYQPGPQSNNQAIQQAFQQANMAHIQPVYIQGVAKLKARITGSIYNPNQYGMNNGTQNMQGMHILNILGVQFHQ